MARLDPATIDLATLTSLAAASANEYLLARLRSAGHENVRTSHGYVFQHLLGDTPPTVSELAELLGVTQQAASKSILELEALGYVERRPDEDDSRARRIALTAKGRAVIERGRTARAKLEAELAEALGSRTLESARRAMLVLLEHTGGLEAVKKRSAKPPST
jgi:DNA-binding MarR family transcriptional regulator